MKKQAPPIQISREFEAKLARLAYINAVVTIDETTFLDDDILIEVRKLNEEVAEAILPVVRSFVAAGAMTINVIDPSGEGMICLEPTAVFRNGNLALDVEIPSEVRNNSDKQISPPAPVVAFVSGPKLVN